MVLANKVLPGEELDYERRRYLQKIHPILAKAFDIIVCLLVRGFLLAQCIFCLYYLCFSTQNNFWVFEIIILVIIVIDTIWVVVKRFGQEWYWFSVSTFAYTFVILTTIWQLVLKKIDDGDAECEDNFTEAFGENLHWAFSDVGLCQFQEILVDVFLLTLILSRWLHPTKTKFKKEAEMTLLLAFITNATDIIEFFAYVDEDKVEISKEVDIAILVFFSLSVVQFSFTLSAKIDGLDKVLERNVPTIIKEAVFATEIWSVLIILITQDLPFCIIRTYIIAAYGVAGDYLLYFFVVKNYVLVIFEVYLITNLILDERHRHNLEKKKIAKRNAEIKLDGNEKAFDRVEDRF